MRVTINQLNEMLQGNIVVTKDAREEIALINLLVNNGHGLDVDKEYYADSVYKWSLKSKRSALLNAVNTLRSNGIEVSESSATSPFTNYYSNTQYSVSRSANIDINMFTDICFAENECFKQDGSFEPIYDLKIKS